MDSCPEEIVRGVVWPLVVLVIVFILREPLSTLLLQITSLTYGKLEVQFQRDIDRIRQKVGSNFPESLPEVDADSTIRARLIEIAEFSPSAVVFDAWNALEAAARSLISRSGCRVAYDEHTPYKSVQNALVKERLIDARKAKVFDDLRRLRNKVAHAAGYRLRKEQAIQYVETAIELKKYLDSLETS